MLQLNDIRITHSRDLTVMIDGLSATFNRGDKTVIIGEEGNGKSTLLKYIYDPALVRDYSDCSGSVSMAGERCGYLPQSLADESAGLTVGEFLGDGFQEALYDRDLSAFMWELGAGFAQDASGRTMSTLSGGEKVRVQLMKILSGRPTVLLLDEPSNDIDIETLEILEDIINGFSGIVLFISHDETLIRNTANTVIHIERLNRKTEPRCTVARLTYEEYVSSRYRAFEKQAMQAQYDLREKRKRDEKLRKMYQQVQSALDNVARDAPSEGRLLKKKMKSVKSAERRFEREDAEMTEIPREELAINLILRGGGVPERKTVLDLDLPELQKQDGSGILSRNVRLSVRGPRKICITGRNGCGKTTLIRKITEQFSERDDLRAEYMPQNYSELLDMSSTPVDVICPSWDPELRKKARNHLAALRFTADEMDHRVGGLSSGQQAKLFLLRIEMSDPNVLILDEPTRNLSPLSGPVIRQMLRNFSGAVISVSHDRRFISEVCDTVYELGPDGLSDVTQRFREDV